MFGPPGRAYVYFTYGMHWCLNVVAHEHEAAGAVLLRAGEVVEGIDTARARRPGSSDRDLARGPARLTRVLGVTGDCDGVDLLDPDSPVRLASPPGRRPRSPHDPWAVSARTGVSGEGSMTPWRFFLPGEPSVSPYRASARRAPS
jgi:DNA-3-methyladenine glycosylase